MVESVMERTFWHIGFVYLESLQNTVIRSIAMITSKLRKLANGHIKVR